MVDRTTRAAVLDRVLLFNEVNAGTVNIAGIAIMNSTVELDSSAAIVEVEAGMDLHRDLPPAQVAAAAEGKSQVNIVNVLVVGIGNFTDPEALVNLASSVQEVAELLVEQGDLETYAEAISDIFVKCFSQLTMQSPAIATLLSLIAKSNRAFPTLVLEKLSVQLMTALQSGDVVVARNHLRSLCCLASAGCVSVDGHGQGVGIVQVLGALCDVAEEESGSSMAVGVEAAIYLLASCVPYVFTALLDAPSPQSAKLAANIAALCRRVTSQDEDGSRRISLFDTDGAQPVFMAAIDGTAAP
ncbi:unnamed protein product, partial [Symbiodinium microadriaticum]